MADDENALADWWRTISGYANPLVKLKGFSLGVYAQALHDAVDRVEEIETEEAEEIAGILRTMAEQADADFTRYTGA